MTMLKMWGRMAAAEMQTPAQSCPVVLMSLWQAYHFRWIPEMLTHTCMQVCDRASIHELDALQLLAWISSMPQAT